MNPPPSEAPSIPAASIPDAVEVALAEALSKATAAGAFDAVKVLVAELEARRKARAGVVDLAAARAARGGR